MKNVVVGMMFVIKLRERSQYNTELGLNNGKEKIQDIAKINVACLQRVCVSFCVLLS